MRDILYRILVWDDGNLPGDLLDEAREALAQPEPMELTDKEILEVMQDGNGCRQNDWQDHIDFARAVIAAHEAKKKEK